jgi:hypothetical protein
MAIGAAHLDFVDARGRIREHHFGEGGYEQSGEIIQRLLAEAGGAGLRGVRSSATVAAFMPSLPGWR